MNHTSRTSALVIALAIAALASPTLAHAKRLGGGKARSIPPASIGKAPAAPAAPKAPAPPV
ncbi:MAG: ABC transporter substrate-binding protein, partial [Burkholderiaceae bacterium]|nr:ABC transporter substrate-binding protein [Burkholderiaceae bacterium]